MNKNIIRIGSLCIFIILIIGLIYFIKSDEGFAPPPTATVSLTNAKQAVTETNTAVAAATKAIGTSTDISTAKDAFTKATAAVSAAKSAVADTKAALGDLNIADLEKIANTAKANFDAAQKAANDKDPAAAKRAYDDAVAKANAAESRFRSLPN
jgi:hypothetical protein